MLSNDTAYVDSLCVFDGKHDLAKTREPLADFRAWLPSLVRRYGAASRTLWLLHEPPAGTPLTKSTGALRGHQESLEAIERFSPLVAVSGHDHTTPTRNGRWHCQIGPSTCINAGQSDSGLHYCIIEAVFEKTTPSLPTRMKITAYPWEQFVTLIDNP